MDPAFINGVLIPSGFGALVAIVAMLAWLSTDHVHQKLGLLLLSAWALSNMVVSYWGFERAALIIPSLDAVIAIVVAMVGYANRARIALVIFILYGIVGLVHVAARIAHAEVTYVYYTITGVLFLVQLLSLGGSSARLAVRAWSPPGGERLRPHRARR